MRIQGKYIVSYKETWTTNLVRQFTHNLGSSDLQVSLWDLTTNRAILPDEMEIINDNVLEVSVSELPGSGIRVIIFAL
jgi:hypothetical protein